MCSCAFFPHHMLWSFSWPQAVSHITNVDTTLFQKAINFATFVFATKGALAS